MPLPQRMATGAVLGFLMGLCTRFGLESVYIDPPGNGSRVLFTGLLVAGAMAGGALAGGLLGVARRHLGTIGGAAAVGAGLTCLVSGTVVLATWHYIAFTAPGLAAYFGISAGVGAPIGLLARDVGRFAPAVETKPQPLRRPPLWVLVLAELGWMMEALPTRRNRHRARLRTPPAPDAWIGIIRRNVPLFSRLSTEDRAALLGHVNVFLAEKRFEGCGGLEITDEIRVTVAAQACMLLLHTPHGYFPTLRTILVYPEAYVPPARDHAGGVMTEERPVMLGESWLRGEVVLSWRSVSSGCADPHDGRNLVLHEFAHQLDQADGAADGIPEMRSFGAYRAWAGILAPRFGALEESVRFGRRTVMDAYGATNRAEFFAVATETFFEKPRQLRAGQPDLYDALVAYYGLDPASAVESGSSQS